MSWMEKLYQTYENNKAHIGTPTGNTLLEPICHTTQNAHIEIVIDEKGSFLRARIIEKTEAPTLVPCTEQSCGRSGKQPISHPLCDKLQYVARDFTLFGGNVTSGFAQNPEKPHRDYVNQLAEWCASPHSHPKVAAVLAYVRKGTVIADLVRASILALDSNRKLILTWRERKEDAPDIFRVLPAGASPDAAFVRFLVEIAGDPQSKLWSDRSVWDSWIDFHRTTRTDREVCYVTGHRVPLADQHPAKIRNSADKAKIISSNDTSGFTFRGRFTKANEAYGIGFEVTQEAHNALRWLIARQGYRDGSQAIVAWAVSGADVPDPFSDTLALLSGDEGNTTSSQAGYTAQETGEKLKKLIKGYSVKLRSTDTVVVMGLDSATPGRMAIRFYRELTGSEFLERVLSWHAGCSWKQSLAKNRIFFGAPAPRDIAEAAYGRRDENLRKVTTERLLPCIIDGVAIPWDLVESCVRRACNRKGLEYWEWEKALGAACALYRYHHAERGYLMALERERNNRDYLYGRLLALAEHLEGRALNVAGEKRETNAAKLMQRFSERPYSTWLTIETSLTPYKIRLRAKRSSFLLTLEKEIDAVFDCFTPEQFLSDQRLTGEFLLGFHCQRSALWSQYKQSDDQEDALEDNSDE